MPDLALPDLSLHYEIEGSGPPLLLIAGMVSDSASWAPLVPLFAADFTVIRPDNRTTGRTIPWDAPVSVSQMAKDCAGLLHHLGLGPAHVLGHSLGGMIALELLLTASDTVASVTLAASAPLRLRRNIALFQALLAIRQSDAPEDTWLRAFFPWLFAPAVYDMPGAVDDAARMALAYPHAQNIDAMAHQLTALQSYTPPQLPRPLPRPVQAVLGADDLLIPPALARAHLQGIPHQMIDNAGHSVHWDAPEAVATALTRFVQEVQT